MGSSLESSIKGSEPDPLTTFSLNPTVPKNTTLEEIIQMLIHNNNFLIQSNHYLKDSNITLRNQLAEIDSRVAELSKQLNLIANQIADDPYFDPCKRALPNNGMYS